MAVPGHDQRDFEFAETMKLPCVRVVAGAEQDASTRSPQPSRRPGRADGQQPRFRRNAVEEAKRAITQALAPKSRQAVVNYRLHDWCISRQRYWGPPIPIIYCDDCGTVPVPEQDLPVILPASTISGRTTPGSRRWRGGSMVPRPVPHVRQAGRRETDVSDTFLDSAWYFLRYPRRTGTTWRSIRS